MQSWNSTLATCSFAVAEDWHVATSNSFMQKAATMKAWLWGIWSSWKRLRGSHVQVQTLMSLQQNFRSTSAKKSGAQGGETTILPYGSLFTIASHFLQISSLIALMLPESLSSGLPSLQTLIHKKRCLAPVSTFTIGKGTAGLNEMNSERVKPVQQMWSCLALGWGGVGHRGAAKAPQKCARMREQTSLP